MKTKRWIGFFLSLLATFAVLGFWNVQRVSAADVTDKAKFENLKVTVAETGSDSHIIIGPSTKTVELKYSGDFSFPGVQADEIKSGDYFIVKAPTNLDLQDQTLDLIDKNSNTTMGTVQVDSKNHQLLFTFNDKVKDKQNIRGSFVATAQQTVEGVTKKVTYTLPGGVTKEIEFEVKKYPKLPHEGELVFKSGINDPKLPRITWHVRINRSKTDMGNHTIKITDNTGLGALVSYIESSFELSEVEYETTDTNYAALKHRIKVYKLTMDPEEYKKDPDNTGLLTFTNGKRGFELLMPTNMGTKSFYLRYLTTSPADTSEVKNSAQYLLDNEPQLIWKKRENTIETRTEHSSTLKTVKSVGANVTADIAGKIKITKFDEADADVKLEGVEFDIIDKATNKVVQTVPTDKDGIALSKALSDGKYIVKEKTPKPGYQVNSQEFEVELKGGQGVPLNISNKRVTVDFEATKTWVNGKATDHKEVKLGLYVHKKGQTVADSKPVSGNYTPEVTESNGVYTYKWINQLPKYDVDGTTELVYSVRELQDQTNLPLQEGEKVAVGDNNYIISYNADKTQVTNTYEVPKIKVTANKVWVGGQERVRPTFYFKLYRTLEGGVEEEVAGVEQKEVPKTNGTVEWTDLPATDEHGVKYTYSVMEVDEDGNLIVDTIDGYTPAQTAGLTVTNTYSTSPTTADIKVKKELTGGRPTPLQANEFEFILKDKNGQEVQRAKNDGDGNVTFKDLPFTQEGHYQYTIVEANAGQTIDGVTHDARTVRVTVHVYDNGRGQLVAWVENFAISALTAPIADFSSVAAGSNLVPPISGAIDAITDDGIQTFTNTYKATKVKVPVAATKTFINKNTDQPIQLKGGEFEFALLDGEGDQVATTTNDAAGNIQFGELEFNKPGEFTYTIIERYAGTTDKGITYSNTTVEVTITVRDNNKGALEASVSYDNNNSTFENTYKAKNAKASLEVTKKLIGRNLETDMFEFALTDQVGNVETAKNGADGKVKFKELSFDEEGTYTYTIKEVKAGTTENGITYDAKTVTAKVTVTDDKEGKLHAAVEYSSDASDGSTTFTNVYTPAKTQVPVKKVWDDGNNQDGKRPGSITVKLLADGVETGQTHELSDANNWQASFTNLDADKGGTPITYTIEEVAVAEYKSKVTGDATTGFTITNRYNPAETNVSVTKVWDDGNNQDGLRPTKIIVNLLADGAKVETKEIQAAQDGSWTATFTGLAKYKNGQEIQYTVTEEAVDGYIPEVTADTATSFTIKNTHDLATVSVEGTKTWDDGDNQDGKRPDKIKVLLNKTVDGVTTKVAEQEVTKDNWTYEFKNLPKYEGGKEITYSIDEEPVEDYKKDIDGYNLKNSYKPAKTEVSVRKVWNDSDNQDGKRPASITVKLLADGKDTGKTLELSEATGWAGSFTELDAQKGGKAIDYKVVEATSITGYTTEVTGDAATGFMITNSYSPETVDIKATKNWDDANNQDGKRPTKITINLLADGEKVDSKDVQAATDGTWTAEFKGKAKYK
ncbi:Cna B-type domain-containing protein, partial [Streptococcus cristatus]|uniref:Cna B-type domain-containing protein n=1 Tax=Streptococcus cristatus TaxID=45634 RepID=UPI0022843632